MSSLNIEKFKTADLLADIKAFRDKHDMTVAAFCQLVGYSPTLFTRLGRDADIYVSTVQRIQSRMRAFTGA